MDESGTAIGIVQATHAIVDITVGSRFQGEPGRQEWVTVVECICADGSSIPPLIIFAGKNLNQNWVPQNLAPSDWKFAANNKGWTSNSYGFEWLRRCFEPATREKVNSRYRLLICDGHDSYISTAFIRHCIDNKIALLILPPHTSHVTQPLDVGVFSSVKSHLTSEVKRFIGTGIA